MRPSKAIGVFGASLGLLGGITFTTCLILADNGAIPFLTESYRSYRGQFYVDDSCVLDVTAKRGTDITDKVDAINLEKPTDNDGYEYQFIGWDTLGNGIPDIPPYYMYYNFKADAVFLKYKIPEFDFSNFDIEKLLDFLEKFDISLEDLLQFLNMDMEDFLDLLDKLGIDASDLFPTVCKVTSDQQMLSPYFRVSSYGDWNVNKKKWNEPDYFDSSTILGRSDINPLDFVANKLGKSSSLVGQVSSTYNFEYLNNKTPRPTAVYQIPGNSEVTSDAYRNVDEVDNKFSAVGYYCAYDKTIINFLKNMSFSDIIWDHIEETYRDYAFSHYLSVPDTYDDIFNTIISNESFNSYRRGSQNFDVIDNVYSYLLNFCDYNADDNLTYRAYDKKVDPIRHFYETKKGSATYFANFATLLFRKLGLPARFVKGYLAYDQIGSYEAELSYMHEWGWTEVYFEGIGWVSMDCNNVYTKATGSYKNGDLSNKISNKGPGKSGPGSATGVNGSVASFKSDYSGTVYFRSKSYDTYLQGEWTSSSDFDVKDEITINPQSFAYISAENYFEDVKFDVTYLMDANYGIAPEYSYVDFTTDDSTYVGPVRQGETKSFSTKMLTYDGFVINLTTFADSKETFTINKKKYYDNYIGDGGSIHDVYTDPDYGLKQSGLTTEIDSAYGSLIGMLCDTQGITAYASNHSRYETMAYVKNYLQTNYVYDVDYDYGDSTDPLLGFYTTGKGICSEFATMATLMFKYLGFESRYVTGYVTSCVPGATCYIGTNTAHAWSEVYFDGVGWISIDCTGFEAGDGSRDPTKEQEENDTTYGQHPSGGGIVDYPPRMTYIIGNNLKFEYSQSALGPGDIYECDIQTICLNNHFIDSDSFNTKYRINFEYVSGSPNSLTPYYVSDIGYSPCYVFYSIISNQTGEDVTNLFFDSDGQSISHFTESSSKPNCAVAEFYDVEMVKKEIVISTGTRFLDVAYLTASGLTCREYTISYGSLYDGDEIRIVESSVPHLNVIGEIDNDFEIEIYHGEVNVTDLYEISYSYGLLTIGED